MISIDASALGTFASRTRHTDVDFRMSAQTDADHDEDNTKNVLVLEPDESIQNLFAAILKRDGYRLTRVRDGKEAVRELERRSFTAIIIDISLGPSSLERGSRRGLGFLHHLQRHAPDLLARVIVVSALAPRDVPRGLPSFCSFLRKPFELEELRKAIATCHQLTRA